MSEASEASRRGIEKLDRKQSSSASRNGLRGGVFVTWGRKKRCWRNLGTAKGKRAGDTSSGEQNKRKVQKRLKV